MRNYNRFIPGEEIVDVEQWRFGAVGLPASQLVSKKNQVMIEEKALVDSANLRQEGFTEGYVQGHAQAVIETQKQITYYIENEGQEQAQRFGQLIAAVKVQLATSEQVLTQGVLSLACEIARQILRQEISVNVDAIKPVIAQGLNLLIDEKKRAKIRLNPIDYEELKDRLQNDFQDVSLALVSDSSVACGGCLIESQETVVDGTIEKRWSRTLATLGLKADWDIANES